MYLYCCYFIVELFPTGIRSLYYWHHYYILQIFLLLPLLPITIITTTIPINTNIYHTQPFYYTTSSGDGYLELDVNIKKFGLLANKTLPLLLSRLHCMDLHIGLCVESREEEEMPEGMLCSVRVHKVSAEPSAVPMWFVRNTST